MSMPRAPEGLEGRRRAGAPGFPQDLRGAGDRTGLRVKITLWFFLLLLALGGQVEAQDSVDLWGAKGEWAGRNADDFAGGYALGMSYVADIGLPVDLGADLLFARFDADQASDLVDEFQFSAVFRRWLLGRNSRVRPFLGARAGYSRLAADLAEYQMTPRRPRPRHGPG